MNPKRKKEGVGLRYKIVEGFPAYRVGTDGSIWSLWKQDGKVWVIGKNWKRRKGTVDKAGYSLIQLTGSNVKKTVRISSLVLTTFRGPKPNSKLHACHNNGKRNDDRLVNLRWDTVKGNCADKIKHGTIARGERNGNTHFNADDILVICKRLAEGIVHEQIAKEFNCAISTISRIKLRQVWGHIPSK